MCGITAFAAIKAGGNGEGVSMSHKNDAFALLRQMQRQVQLLETELITAIAISPDRLNQIQRAANSLEGNLSDVRVELPIESFLGGKL